MGSSSGSESYYTALAKKNYYIEGGEPEGKWFGTGAENLGLQGTVTDKSFKHLLRGFDGEGNKSLVQNAGARNRRPGYDLTFSAPKSVSVFWSQADSQTRKVVQDAQQKAVETALSYLEEQTICRRGKGGQIKDKAQLVIASFEHGTSRADDPQLHTHAIVFNVAMRLDGSTGTIESKPLYQNKMLAGAIYRAELARQLQETLGLRAKKVKRCFEIEGVDTRLIKEFSKRREAIEDYLQKNNLYSAKAAEVAALKTRGTKGHTPRRELFVQWQRVGAEYDYQAPRPNTARDSKNFRLRLHGSGEQGAGEYCSVKRKILVKAGLLVSEQALAEIMEHNAHFTKRELLMGAAVEATPYALSWEEIQQGVEECLQQENIVTLGADERGNTRYTTREMLAVEEKLLVQAGVTKSESSHRCSTRALERAIARRTLTREQEMALKHVIDGQGSLKIISGRAGTGKSYLLEAAKEVWEKSGYKVLGGAFTGKAASALARDAAIEANTLHKLLWSVEKGRMSLDTNTVLVIDEAGMVGTRQLAKLIDLRARFGCKLVLVGDHQQLQPINAGGVKPKLMELLGYARLNNISRQQEEWAREAVVNIVDGRAGDALREYLDRGLLKVAKTSGTAKDELIADWTKYGVSRPKSHLILAAYREDVFDLNRLAQFSRKEAGLLGYQSLRVKGQRLYKGDRIVFTRNCRHNGVKNGQFASVRAIKGEKITVYLDDGGQKTIDTKEYEHIQLGYASTTHKAQGETRCHAYVLMGGDMQDKELSYVQLSRAKYDTRIYAEPLEDTNETFRQLVSEMKRSRQKQMAICFQEQGRGVQMEI